MRNKDNSVKLGNEVSSFRVPKGIVTAILRTLSGRTIYSVTHGNGIDQGDWISNHVSSAEITSIESGIGESYEGLPEPDFLGLELGFLVKEKISDRQGILTGLTNDNYGRLIGTVFFSNANSGSGLFDTFPVRDLTFHNIGVYDRVNEKGAAEIEIGMTVYCHLREVEGLVTSVTKTMDIDEIVVMYMNDKGESSEFLTYAALLDVREKRLPDAVQSKVDDHEPAGCSTSNNLKRNIVPC
ncbi:hypothetical protein [Vibrio owensii]|uniref:hypothetical protein n=1 Tax=Vibrio owensii TaxID=696485 RepID=UPI0018F21FF7|nr:hypothetical protein [Vibrio owensii]